MPGSPHTPPRPPTSPPSPVDIPAIVMPLADARQVDVLAITNGFEPRVKEEFDSEATIPSDSSYTLGSEDSPRSGEWQEYQIGTTNGMDLDDDFVNDDEDSIDKLFR